MIHCRYATTLHTEAREGTLSGWRRAMYALHMTVCPQCQAWAKGLEQTDHALKELPQEKAPEDLEQSLAARLRSKR